uniref:Transcription elongation factor SPT4 n=1 Tax=Heterorhabditis bacteriophora TaxID=37862 RepID=A0A1I7XJ76_HETBA
MAECSSSGDLEEQIIVQDCLAPPSNHRIPAVNDEPANDESCIEYGDDIKRETVIPKKRGRPPKKPISTAETERASHALLTPKIEEDLEELNNSRHRTRSSAKGSLPIDDDENHIFPCPVDVCDYTTDNRSIRNYHVRIDHPGYTYKEGDGVGKLKPTSLSRVIKLNKTLLSKKESVKSPESEECLVHESNNDSAATMEIGQDESRFERSAYEDHIDSDMELLDDEEETFEYENEPAFNSKIRIGDPSGKYACYMPDCNWRGNYRSIRADHMRWCHKDWVQPPRFILQRITKDGIYLDPGEWEPEYPCLVEGCSWRGNYRATRSVHMKNNHPDWQPLKRKASVGGYLPEGKYECHVPNCLWRGSSRSTRATHMRKEHQGFINPIYTTRNVACCDCNIQCTSHKNFVDHMVCEHRIGGIVQREFVDVRDYEEWFDAVQESFSIEFIKRMGVKQTENYQVLYLYCSRSGGYRPKRQRAGNAYVAEYAKRKITRGTAKCGRNCAAFLRVVHWTDGRLTVVGCVEHTGHRMGTVLLRLSPHEREIMDEYLYVVDEDAPLEYVLDRLREMEGYAVDGYEVMDRTVEDMAAYVMYPDNELISLDMLIRNQGYFEEGSTFNVNIVDADGNPVVDGFSLGLMSENMRDLWKIYSARAACIEEVRLMISSWDVSLFFVLVFDDSDSPRCACVYLSQQADKAALLRQLKQVHDGAIETIVTDCSADWPILIEQLYGENSYASDVQIAEWHLLPEWAAHCDQLVQNRVDRFTIICALRRWIRASDPTLFEGMVIDMFEALREMELDELAQHLDAQLTDPEYAKRYLNIFYFLINRFHGCYLFLRWTPLNRNPLTEHSNPTLEIACRMLRERFLNCELCSRLDEYVGLLMERINEFNNCRTSGVFATRPIEPPRQVPQMYEDIDPSQMLADGTVVAHDIDPRMANILMPRTVDGDADVMQPDETKRMKVEVEEYDMVAEEEIVEEVIEGPEAEELVEEAVMSGALVNVIAGGNEKTDSPSTSTQDTATNESEMDRKARLRKMMQMLREKVDSLADDETMELMETSLSQVVEQLDTSTPIQLLLTYVTYYKYILSGMSVDTIPRDLRGLRACLLCSLVKSMDQFEQDGCENCDRVLHMKGDTDKVYECTSTNFDGMIAAMMPEDSWVCKWQKINRKCKGIYAVSVSGSLPSSVVSELKSVGIRYKPGMRDTASK